MKTSLTVTAAFCLGLTLAGIAQPSFASESSTNQQCAKLLEGKPFRIRVLKDPLLNSYQLSLSELAKVKPARGVQTGTVELEGLEFNKMAIEATRPGEVQKIVWGQVSSNGQPFRLGKGTETFKSGVTSVEALWAHAGLTFVTADLNPAINYVVHLRTSETESLSKKLGEEVWLEQTFTSQGTRQVDWTSLPFSDFKAMSESGLALPDVHLTSSSMLTHVGFSARAKTPPDDAIFLTISDSIIPDIFLPDDTDVKRLLLIEESVEGQPVQRGSNGQLQTRDFEVQNLNSSPAEILSALSSFMQSMQNPANQKYAAQIVAKGPAAIEAELNKAKLSISTYEDVTIGRITPVLSEKVTLATLMDENILASRIPYEGGAFGSLHGVWSHQAQMIAGLRNLTERDRAHFHNFLVNYIAPSSRLWPIWNLLFDSRGYTTHGNRFWRDLKG